MGGLKTKSVCVVGKKTIFLRYNIPDLIKALLIIYLYVIILYSKQLCYLKSHWVASQMMDQVADLIKNSSGLVMGNIKNIYSFYLIHFCFFIKFQFPFHFYKRIIHWNFMFFFYYNSFDSIILSGWFFLKGILKERLPTHHFICWIKFFFFFFCSLSLFFCR